jgi:alpha-tubulin suppressor-like RCC1 family protein
VTFNEETEPKAQITKISAGSEFAFAWNNLTELYSWGFGMNYVLLNGEQNEEYEPFKVRNKIINDEIIEEIQAGGQHVLYMAYEKTESKVKLNIGLDKRVTTLMGVEKNRLSRKKKN